MTEVLVQPLRKRRAEPPEVRREQLITATITCIARNGMSATTMAEVTKEAGLSQGIVNLHFESKENLLNETLRYLADEYKTQFDKALATAGPRPAEKLRALMELDLRPSICDRRKISVWFAFWSEVKSRPMYRKICDASDRHYDAVIESLCEKIIAEGNYDQITASAVAIGLTAMTNGLWLSYLISPNTFDRQNAANAINEYLCSVFPKHF